VVEFHKRTGFEIAVSIFYPTDFEVMGMPSAGPLQRRREEDSWRSDKLYLGRRLETIDTLEQVTASPWLISLAVMVLGPLVILRLIGLYYTAFDNPWRDVHPYEYAYQSRIFDIVAVRRFEQFAWQVPLPWPQYERGRLGWYRQGLREVARHRPMIEALTEGQDLGIVLAAAIANQGNSYQRPLGWDGLERIQVWIGEHISWPWPEWTWARQQWEASFKQYSVGIGQITPLDTKVLGYAAERVNLLEEQVSIQMMLEKLSAVHYRANLVGIERNDSFILMLIANNSGLELINVYNNYGRDMAKFLSQVEGAREQLSKMMTYIYYLHTQEDWPLPADINWDYVMALAR
jgi:hypothetical protein